MSLRINPLSINRINGGVYTFERAGDALPMHRHDDSDVHITIVARGRFRVHGPEIGDKEYESGAVLDWNTGVDHEFIALTDGARLVNILKNWVPGVEGEQRGADVSG